MIYEASCLIDFLNRAEPVSIFVTATGSGTDLVTYMRLGLRQ